jgi:succinate dehydrogenase / fumarate reductase, membrane anchor subunit
MTAYRTPLKNVRGLGAAKGGTEHFIVQRVTAAANIVLIAFLVYAALNLVGAGRGDVKAFFSQPIAAVLGVLLGISASVHMRIGMQVIIEDYVHGGWKVPLLLLNTFFSIFVGAAIALAVIKLYLGV